MNVVTLCSLCLCGAKNKNYFKVLNEKWEVR